MNEINHRILIVDNDRAITWVLEKAFADENYSVDVAMNGKKALEMIDKYKYALVVMDVMMPVMDGIKALEIIKKKPDRPETIIMTGHTSMENTIEAMKHGAFEYILKPFDIDDIISLAKRAIEKYESREKEKQNKKSTESDKIIGKSPSMHELYKMLGRIASTDSSVLITGETGTGKDLFARVIHHHSARRDSPFIVVNCASIPAELLESELFGHVKGAFTGATSERKGKCELADKGILFLDEIGTMRFDLQAKLLTFLQRSEFERVGSSTTLHVDVRVIAATNADLKKLTQKKLFREDLYYRLMVVPIHIIPLRERKEDIIPLAEHFVKIFNSKYGYDFKLTEGLEKELIARQYPGNVRELENYIHRIVVLQFSDIGDMEKQEISLDVPGQNDLESINVIVSNLVENSSENLLNKARERIESPLLLKIMSRFGENQSKAAEALGVSRNTLRKMLAKYNMND
ncbi:sigma-54-dependent transcriptional regulator [Candidatus Latescibacterota bacterium]